MVLAYLRITILPRETTGAVLTWAQLPMGNGDQRARVAHRISRLYEVSARIKLG